MSVDFIAKRDRRGRMVPEYKATYQIISYQH